MEEHLDLEEGQRLEAAKAFAYRHRFLLVGLAVAVLAGAAAGWGYSRYRHSQQLEASGHYRDSLTALAEGRHGDARQTLKTLIQDFGGTTYAPMGRVLRARLLHADGSPDKALAVLEPLLEGQAGASESQHIAVEEAARIQWEQGETAQALATLDRIGGTAYLPSYFQLRGDLLADAERFEAARNAYRRALEQPGSGPLRTGLQARLDQLPAPASGASETAGPE